MWGGWVFVKIHFYCILMHNLPRKNAGGARPGGGEWVSQKNQGVGDMCILSILGEGGCSWEGGIPLFNSTFILFPPFFLGGGGGVGGILKSGEENNYRVQPNTGKYG
jgi:hypothetical protein